MIKTRINKTKASPATWVILGLIVVIVCLSVVSVHFVKKTKNQEASISKLEKKVEKVSPPKTTEMLPYQKLYPELKVKKADEWTTKKKTVYLTFDDGPTKKITPSILKTLKKENVKATFFVIGKGSEHDLMKKIVEDGHAIGIHAYDHKYKKIYKSVDSYVEDFNSIFNLIKEETGVTPTVYRYPGGSNNVYNTMNQEETTAEMFRRGFSPFDWNVDSTDASGNDISVKQIVKNATKGTDMDRAIILMHDSATKSTTAKALPEIIKKYKKAGYSFEVLTNQVTPILFSTPDGVRYD